MTRRLFPFASLLALAIVPACSADGRPSGRDAGGDGQADSGGGPVLVDSGPVVRRDGGPSMSDECDERARWIYLVDSGNALLRFEPDSGTLTPIGTLDCPSGGATPFSMAVDRDASALVLHQDHRLYRVSTTDASCEATTFTPDQAGFELFGMGFVSDSDGSATETLFIAGGPESGIGSGSSTLGSIDVASWTASSIGGVHGSPELTGTGSAELWGFFPDSSPMSVRQLDKTNGATLREIDVSSIDSDVFSTPAAWAFAFWGGRFYIFYMSSLDSSTSIYRVTPDSGAVELMQSNIGYRIVGAGVSTCAPVILI